MPNAVPVNPDELDPSQLDPDAQPFDPSKASALVTPTPAPTDPDAAPAAAPDASAPPPASTAPTGTLSDKLTPAGSSGAPDSADMVLQRIRARGASAPASVEYQTIDTDSIHHAAVPQVETPAAFQTAVSNLDDEGKKFGDDFRGQMSGQEKQVFSDWEAQKQKLTDLYAAAKDRVGWAEAASMMGQGLAKLAAGLYGMRTGVDTSGIQFNPVDWSHQYNRLLDEYKLNLDQTHAQMQPRLQAIENQRKDYENWQMRMGQARERLGAAQQNTNDTNAHMLNENDRDYANKLFEANKFNTESANAAKRFGAQFDMEYARFGKQLPEAQLNAARAMYTQAAGDYNKGRNDYANGLALLQEANNESNEKARDLKVNEAMKQIAPYLQDPQAAASAVSHAGKSHTFLGTGFGGRTDYAAVVQQLDKMPKRNPPRFNDYMPGGSAWGDVNGVAGVSQKLDQQSGTGGPGKQAGGVDDQRAKFEAGIKATMDANPGASREQVIQSLQQKRKLPSDYQ